jgi:hypothetical protein
MNLRMHNVKGGDASLILYPLFRLTRVKKNRVLTFYKLLLGANLYAVRNNYSSSSAAMIVAPLIKLLSKFERRRRLFIYVWR